MRDQVARALAASVVAALAFGSAGVAHAETSKRACVQASTEGQTLRREDKLLAARDAIRICAADACPAIVKSHCNRWLSEIEAQIPTAIVRARDAAGGDVFAASLTIDGKPGALGRPETLDPGEHVATVKGPNGASADKKFLLVDGEKGRVVTVDLPGPGAQPSGEANAAASATAPARGGRIPVGAWVLGGVGIVALGTSAAFAVVTSNDLSSLRVSCAPACTDAETASGRAHALIADVALGVGVAAAGGAIVWALLGRGGGDAKPAPAAASLDVRPVAGGVLGTVAFRF